jgi:exodeoxyribonuclease V alpha subunit
MTATDLLVPPAVSILEPFVEAGVFGPTEVHLAATLAHTVGAEDPAVLLGAALAARAPLHGSVCIDVATIAHTVVSSLREPVDVVASRPADEVVADRGATDDDDDRTLLRVGDAGDADPDLDALGWPDARAWLAALAGSDLVDVVPPGDHRPAPAGDGLLRPLVLDHGRLYLARYWHLERFVADDLLARTRAEATTDSAGPSPDTVAAAVAERFATTAGDPAAVDPAQLAAAQAVAHRNLVVIAGGPGTGKTTTVARLLTGLVLARPGGHAAAVERIALAAPTGKAAARMTEAIRQAVERDAGLPADVADHLRTLEATTIHRLLGPRGVGFRHGPDNPLPHDLVIVDEVSMVSLSLMAHLLAGIRHDATVVLVGDPHQLASVEAGTVLGDVVGVRTSGGEPTPPSGVAPSIRPLATVHRQAAGSAVLDLAAAVREGRSDDVLAVLRAEHPEVQWIDASVLGDHHTASEPTLVPRADRPDRAAGEAPETSGATGPQPTLFDVGLGDPEVDGGEDAGRHRARFEALRAEVFAVAERAVRSAARGLDDADGLHDALDAIASLKVLCALRNGPGGVDRWNRDVDDHLRAAHLISRGDWYPGRPTMVTENDYVNHVFNGDVGVAVRGPDPRRDGSGAERHRVVFARAGREPTVVEAVRLDRVATQWAMSIHKSQGSEFPHAVVVLPPPPARILTRELLYTAVTRARERVTLVASEAAVRAAVDRPVARASGLAARLV